MSRNNCLVIAFDNLKKLWTVSKDNFDYMTELEDGWHVKKNPILMVEYAHVDANKVDDVAANILEQNDEIDEGLLTYNKEDSEKYKFRFYYKKGAIR